LSLKQKMIKLESYQMYSYYLDQIEFISRHVMSSRLVRINISDKCTKKSVNF